MKKLFLLCVVLLAVAGCGNVIKNENGSQNLVQLDAEPKDCALLYKMDADVSVYSVEDAHRYMENRIIDQAKPGNAYWITGQYTKPNKWVIFGPERSFVLSANVYDCPYLSDGNK
ncbi:MAG: hypothetical protein R8N50_01970 [Alphaproteobacteria bacterium]|nr:hypothetical protein [Alphaproteobacteria bacterium]